MNDTILGITGIAGFLVVLVIGVLTILLPVMVYTAQLYASRCFRELKKTNELLKELLEVAR